MSSEGILVAVRARPLNERERKYATENGVGWIIDPDNNTIRQDAEGKQSMSFDRVFGEDATNAEVYITMAKPVVNAVLNGINGTIFAYGQTSSGKTYSMQGIMDQGIHEIFKHIANDQGRKYTVKVSYLEIYNEELTDLLLEPGAPKKPLKIQMTENGVPFIGGLTEKVVSNAKSVFALLAQGQANRQVGATAMNDQSSRSHTIFTLAMTSEPVTSADASSASLRGTLSSKINFVDLAGSERASQTQATGQRLKEGAHINKSLLALGAVIRKLSEAREKGMPPQHVPFRDSKLTRILQPALGGNNKTAIICCITQSAHHLEDTMRTLGFAWRAKRIRNNIEVNEVLDDRQLIAKLRREVAVLKEYLIQLTGKPVNMAELMNKGARPSTAPVISSAPAERAEQSSKAPFTLSSDAVAAIDGAVAAAMQAELDTTLDEDPAEECNSTVAFDSSSMLLPNPADVRMIALEKQNETMRECINSLSEQLLALKDQIAFVHQAKSQADEASQMDATVERAQPVDDCAQQPSQPALSADVVELVSRSVEAFISAMNNVSKMPVPEAPELEPRKSDDVALGAKRHWTEVMAEHRRKRSGLRPEDELDSLDNDIDQLANAGFFELPATLRTRRSLGASRRKSSRQKRVQTDEECKATTLDLECDDESGDDSEDQDEENGSDNESDSEGELERTQHTSDMTMQDFLAKSQEAAALKQELEELKFVFAQVQRNLVRSIEETSCQDQRTIQTLSSQLEATKKQAEEIAERLEQKETEVVAHAAALDAANAEIDRLRSRMRELERVSREYESQVHDSNMRRNEAEAELVKATALAEELAETLERAEEQSSEQIKAIQERAHAETERLEKIIEEQARELEKLRRENKAQREAVESLNDEKGKLSKQLERTLARLKAKEEELERADARLLQFEEAQAALAEARTQLQLMEQRAAAAIAERRVLADELAQQKSRAGDYEATVAQEMQRAEAIQARAERARAMLEQRIEELSDELAKLQGELIRRGDIARRDVERERNRADELERTLQRERAEADRKATQAADALERATYEAHRMRDKALEELENEWQAKFTRQREESEARLREEERLRREERRTLELRALTLEDELERERTAAQEREEQLEARIRAVQEAVARAEEAQKAAEAKAHQLEAELQAEVERAAQLAASSAERERVARAEGIREATEQLRTQIEEARQRELESEQRANKERRAANDAASRAQLAERAAAAHAEECEKARSERDSAVREREAARTEATQAKRASEQLKLERDALQKEVELLRNHVASAKSAIEQERVQARKRQKELESTVVNGVEAARKEEAESWQLKLERLQQAHQARERELLGQLEDRDDEVDRLKSNHANEIETLKRQLYDLKARVRQQEQSKAREDAEQIETMRDEIARLNSMLASISRTLTEKDEALRHAQLRLDDINTLSAELEKAKKYQQVAKKYKEQINKMTADYEALKRELEDARAINEGYVRKNLELEQRCKDAESRSAAAAAATRSGVVKDKFAEIKERVKRYKEREQQQQSSQENSLAPRIPSTRSRFALEDDEAEAEVDVRSVPSSGRARAGSARSRSSSRDAGRDLAQLKEVRLADLHPPKLLDISFENDAANVSTMSDIDTSEQYDSAPAQLPSRSAAGSSALSRLRRMNSNSLNLATTGSSAQAQGSAAAPVSLRPAASSLNDAVVTKKPSTRSRHVEQLPPAVDNDADSTVMFYKRLQLE